MLRKIFLALIGLTVVLGCTLATKANPSLNLGRPIACSLGKDCFILFYPDRDPTSEAIDFGCGRMTYDGHTGTDFAIADERVMNQGVSVKAVAAGKVLRVRDEVPDVRQANPNQLEAVKGFGGKARLSSNPKASLGVAPLLCSYRLNSSWLCSTTPEN